MKHSRISGIAIALSVLVAPAVLAQVKKPAVAPKPVAWDRNVIPSPTAAPTFKVPAWTMDTLSNGARLVVVERHALPIVNVQIHFNVGTTALGASPAIGTFLGSMMREGTESRSADQLANDLALLGTGINIGASTEAATAGFSALTRNFDKAADLMMDMMLHSTFPAASLERLRTQAVSSYQRAQDSPTTVAAQVGAHLVYGDLPYGHTVTDADLKGVSREDIVRTAKQVFVPANAVVYVVGDMTRAQAKAALERAFKAWPNSGAKVDYKYAAAPALGTSTIYLVDMPNKPQSVLRIGRALPPAYGPDMAKIDLANYILGGGLQSRLSANIREAHGYSYGFNSGLGWSKGPGPFTASGSVTREKTDSAVIEAMKEVRGMSGDRPVTAAEMTAAKNALTQSLPGRLQSNAGVSAVVSRVVDENLSRDWWTQYIATIEAATPEQVAQTSRQYLDAGHVVILVVGDGAKITDALKASGVGPVVVIDKSGNKLP